MVRKPKVPGKRIALNQLIDKRTSLVRHVENLQKQLDNVRVLQV